MRTTIAAVVGGTASALGGGKFANGAFTAAFQHLLNAEGSALLKNHVFKKGDFEMREENPPNEAGWVETDGNGHLVPIVPERFTDPIMRDAIIVHENSHIEDALASDPEIGQGPKGLILSTSNLEAKAYTELKAYLTEADFISVKLPKIELYSESYWNLKSEIEGNRDAMNRITKYITRKSWEKNQIPIGW